MSSRISAEEIRNRFGLTYNEAHEGGSSTHPNGANAETGAIYDRESGQYIGTASNIESAAKDYKGIHDFAKSSGLLQEDVGDFDTINDVASIVGQIHDRGGESKGEEADTTYDPADDSPEYAAAKERVAAYTEKMASGEAARELFKPEKAKSFFEKYKLNLGEKNLQPSNLNQPAVDPTEAFLADK